MFKNYNMNQIVLPLDLEVKLQKDDIAFHVYDIIEAQLKDSIRLMWLAQGYEPSYRTINRFRVQAEVKDLLRQSFVQFRCQLVEEKLIDQEAVFIDGTKIEASANNFTFIWRKSNEKYHQSVIGKSNQLSNELLENEIIPEIERENEEQLSLEELTQLVPKVDDVVTEYDKQIESSEVQERKVVRSARKYLKRVRKQ